MADPNSDYSVSEISICSGALNLLGDKAIQSFIDPTQRAKVAKELYALARDATLRSHPWNFALLFLTLAQLQAAPPWGWTFAYQIPGHVLRIWKLEDKYADWRVVGRQLYADIAPMNVIAIQRITDPMAFDPLFVDALQYRLASALAYPLTADNSLSEIMWKRYELRLQEARSIDGIEGIPEVIEIPVLVDARR